MGEFKIGFFPGVWDFVHAGHVMALEEAKRYCDFLIVGIKTDPSKDQPNKNKPIMSVTERVKMLLANRYVDKVWFYDTEKELEDYDQGYNFDVRFMGADHQYQPHHKILGQIVYLNRNHEYSSTNIRKRCKKS